MPQFNDRFSREHLKNSTEHSCTRCGRLCQVFTTRSFSVGEVSSAMTSVSGVGTLSRTIRRAEFPMENFWKRIGPLCLGYFQFLENYYRCLQRLRRKDDKIVDNFPTTDHLETFERPFQAVDLQRDQFKCMFARKFDSGCVA